jgi:hypothetical protein
MKRERVTGSPVKLKLKAFCGPWVYVDVPLKKLVPSCVVQLPVYDTPDVPSSIVELLSVALAHEHAQYPSRGLLTPSHRGLSPQR